MARKSTQGRPATNRRRTSSASKSVREILPDTDLGEIRQELGGYNLKNLGRKLRANPLALNAGIGVGAYLLMRYAIRFYKSNPQISEFIRDNFDTVEGKLREFRGSSDEDTMADARH